jgi:aminoglycoside phosphotransferase
MHLTIARFIHGAALQRDEVGESPCEVRSFYRGEEFYFLKMSPAIYKATTYSVLREAAVLRWLAGTVNVPEVVLTAQGGHGVYMITRAVPGVPLAERIEDAPALFAQALRQIQSIDIADCPFDSSAAMRLRELELLLSEGLIDEDYDLSEWPDLHTPHDLLAHLHATVPDEDLVFSHGDLGDSNIFVTDSDELYFIDLGRGGKADRWLDIAFIHRNLREEVDDATAKRRFFEQLDELF